MSIADEIRKLAELRDSGTLSQDEFERAKARVFGTMESAEPSARATGDGPVVLRRARRDRWIGGVCGGLGAYSGVESWIWRVIFIAAVLFAGFGFLPYFILWIFVPVDEQL